MLSETQCRVWVTLGLLAAGGLGGLAQETAQRPTCAVIPFKNLTEQPGSAYLAAVIDQSLYPAMARVGHWQLVERARLRELLREADLKASGIASGRPIQLAGAQVVVVGEYRDAGGVVTVAARLVNAETGEVIRQHTWTGHVSGIPDTMAPRLAAVLAGQPPPKDGLSPEMQELFQKACKLLESGRIDQAIEACGRILDRHRGDVPTLLLRGHAQLQKKGWTRYAVKDFQSILDADADNVAAKLGLARARLSDDRRSMEQALKLLREVLQDNPEQGEAMWLTAVAQSGLGQLAEANSSAEQATQAMPEFSPAWQTLAGVQLSRGEAAKAVESGTKATTYGPDDPAAWMLLGDAQWAVADRPAAQKSYRKALACNPPPDLKEQLKARLLKFN